MDVHEKGRVNERRVLLADGNAQDAKRVGRLLFGAGVKVTAVDDGVSAWREAASNRYDLVLSDVELPGLHGIELVRKIRQCQAGLPVVLFSGQARVDDAVEAIKSGASDFLIKPLTKEMIEAVAGHIAGGRSVPLRRQVPEKHTIITCDPGMQHLLKIAGDVADSTAAVLIQGESGTGKELFARYIHRLSGRKHRPFVAVNCAALPETLLESELFGHEKGAFTGAYATKKGRFELADGGTLLLDEISEMDYPLQSKLLRVLQEREIDRLGARTPIPIDVRVIATTNRDLKSQIAEGRFREDLYYRLNVIPVHLPPLRERVGDIPLLADFFIGRYNALDGRCVKGLTDEALAVLSGLPWKGNIRELENTLERAVLLCKESRIDAATLSIIDAPRPDPVRQLPGPPVFPLKEMEKQVIFQALDHTDGNRTHAAEMLGISVRTLRNKLHQYRVRMEGRQHQPPRQERLHP